MLRFLLFLLLAGCSRGAPVMLYNTTVYKAIDAGRMLISVAAVEYEDVIYAIVLEQSHPQTILTCTPSGSCDETYVNGLEHEPLTYEVRTQVGANLDEAGFPRFGVQEIWNAGNPIYTHTFDDAVTFSTDLSINDTVSSLA